ncbi:hypothetical protein DPMN_093443 [Dreissena polymorpha]|uniref:Uncharacterized protein n=1 Tax=Dreissena polymorpha TaxID=45954 RepID=A0A9D4R1W5_DREPO|nr:hypothetical protein DPMN_093443 [Dreissena polymorpha]
MKNEEIECTKNEIKRKSKRKSVPVETTDTSETETSDSSDEDVSLRKVPKGFDRHLRFAGSINGKGYDFDSFKLKFKSYAKAFIWTEDECRYCVCWSLQGDAAKYHTLISRYWSPHIQAAHEEVRDKVWRKGVG